MSRWTSRVAKMGIDSRHVGTNHRITSMASGCDATRGAKLHLCIRSGGVGRDDFGKLLPFLNEGSTAAVSVDTSAARKHGMKGHAAVLSKMHPFLRYQPKGCLRMKFVHIK